MIDEFEWDEEKAGQNLLTRGLHFSAATDMDRTTAQVIADDRTDYGDERLTIRGFIGNRLHILVYVMRGDKVRIISLRKANIREQRAYANETGRDIG